LWVDWLNSFKEGFEEFSGRIVLVLGRTIDVKSGGWRRQVGKESKNVMKYKDDFKE
jgi:hypothetical protein